MKNLDCLNVLIVGVGGQGTLLASKFLGAAAALCGKDVKVSEVHGMSQRGGSVITCVKIGDKIASPIIDEGEADVILAFEQLEAIRWLPYLKKGGTVITNVSLRLHTTFGYNFVSEGCQIFKFKPPIVNAE